MKILLRILFVIFIIWMFVGGYLEYTKHPKGPIVMGLGVLFLSFVLMPTFIYWRYRRKYKKYIIKDDLFFSNKEKKDPVSN